jgi:hypothetical protein
MTLKIVRREIPQWGTTYGPGGDGPFPAIMVLHGSDGAWSGWSHRHAVILAAHGFLVFPFGYSKGGNYWNAAISLMCRWTGLSKPLMHCGGSPSLDRKLVFTAYPEAPSTRSCWHL